VGGLTAKKVEREKQPGRYSDGNGLYLEIRAGKRGLSKCFLFRYERDGRERWMGLGATHTVSLQRARADAKAAREKLREGVDPIDAKHEARGKEREARKAKNKPPKVTTFRHAAERYMATQEGSWRSATHRGQWRATLATYAYPIIGDMPVADVNTDAVLRVLQPVWTSKQVTAIRLRGRIERILNWAKALGLRAGENPAQWKGHLENLLQRPKREKEHHLALPYNEIPAFMAELRQHESTAARALELCVLTATRSAEVLGARWDEVNFDDRVWTIDKSRMKPGKEHSIPLSDRPSKSSKDCCAKRVISTFLSARRVGPWGMLRCGNYCGICDPASCRTDSGRHLALGPVTRLTTPITSLSCRSHTRSAPRSSGSTNAAQSCSISAAN
jgi:integrase